MSKFVKITVLKKLILDDIIVKYSPKPLPPCHRCEEGQVFVTRREESSGRLLRLGMVGYFQRHPHGAPKRGVRERGRQNAFLQIREMYRHKKAAPNPGAAFLL